MPLSLRELEGAFWRSLQSGAPDPALEAVVEASPTLDPADRIRVYTGMYIRRLCGVLHEDFPKTARQLEPKAFDALAEEYVRAHPSEHPSVRHMGSAMARFLAGRVPPDRLWLADLARLEWARLEVFDAPDEPTLALADLAAWPPAAFPGLVFRPIRALEVVRSGWPVHRGWAAEGPTALDAEPVAIRVWRQDGLVYHGPMDAFEATGIERLRAGDRFGTICGLLAEIAPDRAAEEAGGLLARWLEDGLLAGATPDPQA